MRAREWRYTMAALLATLALAGCDGNGNGITDPPILIAPIELQADVNVQLGNTAAGVQPPYTVTGRAVALREGIAVNASVDSVLVYYRYDDDAWSVLRRASAFPFAGVLPVAVQAGQPYEVWAIVHASAGTGAHRVTARDEWVASGGGYVP